MSRWLSNPTGEDWVMSSWSLRRRSPALSDPPTRLIPIVVRGRGASSGRSSRPRRMSRSLAVLRVRVGVRRIATPLPRRGVSGAAEYAWRRSGAHSVDGQSVAGRVVPCGVLVSGSARGCAACVGLRCWWRSLRIAPHVLLPGRVNVFRGPNSAGKRRRPHCAQRAIPSRARNRRRCVRCVTRSSLRHSVDGPFHEFASRTVVENASAEEKFLFETAFLFPGPRPLRSRSSRWIARRWSSRRRAHAACFDVAPHAPGGPLVIQSQHLEDF